MVTRPTGKGTSLRRINSLSRTPQLTVKEEAWNLSGWKPSTASCLPLQLLLAKPDPEQEVWPHTGRPDSRLFLEDHKRQLGAPWARMFAPVDVLAAAGWAASYPAPERWAERWL